MIMKKKLITVLTSLMIVSTIIGCGKKDVVEEITTENTEVTENVEITEEVITTDTDTNVEENTTEAHWEDEEWAMSHIELEDGSIITIEEYFDSIYNVEFTDIDNTYIYCIDDSSIECNAYAEPNVLCGKGYALTLDDGFIANGISTNGKYYRIDYSTYIIPNEYRKYNMDGNWDNFESDSKVACMRDFGTYELYVPTKYFSTEKPDTYNYKYVAPKPQAPQAPSVPIVDINDYQLNVLQSGIGMPVSSAYSEILGGWYFACDKNMDCRLADGYMAHGTSLAEFGGRMDWGIDCTLVGYTADGLAIYSRVVLVPLR